VNDYLAEIAGEGMTAKTFRTWGGTLAAFELAQSLPPEARLTPRMLADAAAERLFNTPTVCRKSYIHPAVLDLAGQSAETRAALNSLPCPEIADLRISASAHQRISASAHQRAPPDRLSWFCQ
jgi:DNA topoisomerase-1